MRKKTLLAVAMGAGLSFLLSGCNGIGYLSVDTKKQDRDKSVQANTSLFVKNMLLSKSDQIKDINISLERSVELGNGWRGDVVNFSLVAPDGQKIENQKGYVFTDGTYYAPEIFTVDAKKLSSELVPPLSEEAYADNHKIFSGDSKDTIVFFSNPQCPHCVQTIPDALDKAIQEGKTIYYHDLMLPMFPNANNITLVMATAMKKFPEFKIQILKKIYSIQWQDYNAKLEEVINLYNASLVSDDTLKPITLNDIEEQKARDHASYSAMVASKNGVQGTPTVFVNGKKLER